jgi:phosphatidylglycerol:prolipoprotein diacylglycerol transferase
LNYLEYPDWITPEIIPGVPWLSWLRWYGLMYIVIMVITFYLFKHQVKEQKLGIEDKKIEEFFGYGLLGMLVFARIFATLIYNDDRIFYLTNPWWIIIPFNPNTGALGFAGMSYHGGLLGVIVGDDRLRQSQKNRSPAVGRYAGGGLSPGLYLWTAGQLYQR